MTDPADRPHTHGYYAERVTSLVHPVSLRDGTAAWVGPLLHTDRDDLAREYETLSFTSKYSRFLAGVAHLSPQLLDHLVDDVDGVDHVALVLFAEDTSGDLVPAGIGRIVRYAETPDAADVAITVKDQWQNRGVATALLPLLMARRPAGVTHLLTEVADNNVPSLKMLRRLGEMQVHRAGGGALDVEVDLTKEGLRHSPPADGDRLHPALTTQGHDRLRVRDRDAWR